MLITDRPASEILRRIGGDLALLAQDRARPEPDRLALAGAATTLDAIAASLEGPAPQALCDRCGAPDRDHPGQRCATCRGTTYLPGEADSDEGRAHG